MSLALIKFSNLLRNSFSNFFFYCGKREIGLYFPMSFLSPLWNIGFILAIFILEGNTPVLNELLQMCVRGVDIMGMTLATISMLIS